MDEIKKHESGECDFGCSRCLLNSPNPRDEWVVWWNEVRKPQAYEDVSDMEMIAGGETAAYCSTCWGLMQPDVFFIPKRGVLIGDTSMQHHECYSCEKELRNGVRFWDLGSYHFKRRVDGAYVDPDFLFGLSLGGSCVKSLDVKTARLVANDE